MAGSVLVCLGFLLFFFGENLSGFPTSSLSLVSGNVAYLLFSVY